MIKASPSSECLVAGICSEYGLKVVNPINPLLCISLACSSIQKDGLDATQAHSPFVWASFFSFTLWMAGTLAIMAQCGTVQTVSAPTGRQVGQSTVPLLPTLDIL